MGVILPLPGKLDISPYQSRRLDGVADESDVAAGALLTCTFFQSNAASALSVKFMQFVMIQVEGLPYIW